MQAFIPKNLVKYKVVLTYLFLRTISFRHQFWVIGSLNIKKLIKSILTVFFLQRQWRRARRLVHGQSVRPALPVQRAHAARPAPTYSHFAATATTLHCTLDSGPGAHAPRPVQGRGWPPLTWFQHWGTVAAPRRECCAASSPVARAASHSRLTWCSPV